MLHRVTHNQVPQRIAPSNTMQKEFGFHKAEIFTGTVLEKFPRGEVLIAAKGRLFRAHTALDLMERGGYQFQVNSLGPKIELKVLDGLIQEPVSPLHLWTSDRMPRDGLATTLWILSKIHGLEELSRVSRQVLKELHHLTSKTIFSGYKGDSGNWAARFLAGSGLFWENKVFHYLFGKKRRSFKNLICTDLKGTLLLLSRTLRLEEKDNVLVKSLLTYIDQALNQIEEDQLLNVSSVRDGLGWFWSISGCEDDGLKKANIFFKGKRIDDEVHFFMRLEFTHLGQLEIEVFIIKSIFGMKIFVEDKEKVEFVTDHLPALKRALQGVGLEPGTIVCDVKDGQNPSVSPFTDGHNPSVHLVI